MMLGLPVSPKTELPRTVLDRNTRSTEDCGILPSLRREPIVGKLT